jgi:hypothetical protein
MVTYPILFNVRDPVVGKGFLAGVAIAGRVLMREEEEGGYWIDGVFPGAVSAGGRSKDEALLKFREIYRMVLYDYAAAAESFQDFKREVERFFWEETPGAAAAWKEAAEELRRDKSRAGDWLPVTTKYSEPWIGVALLDCQNLEPAENPEEKVELAGDSYDKAA